jgi:exonuclease III
MASDNILVWDVRGLNTRLHRDVVRSLVGTEHPSLIYLQETKLSVISDFDIMQILGAGYDYVFIPASHTWWHFGCMVLYQLDSLQCVIPGFCAKTKYSSYT